MKLRLRKDGDRPIQTYAVRDEAELARRVAVESSHEHLDGVRVRWPVAKKAKQECPLSNER